MGPKMHLHACFASQTVEPRLPKAWGKPGVLLGGSGVVISRVPLRVPLKGSTFGDSIGV